MSEGTFNQIVASNMRRKSLFLFLVVVENPHKSCLNAKLCYTTTQSHLLYLLPKFDLLSILFADPVKLSALSVFSELFSTHRDNFSEMSIQF